jgi:hypothetical protein
MPIVDGGLGVCADCQRPARWRAVEATAHVVEAADVARIEYPPMYGREACDEHLARAVEVYADAPDVVAIVTRLA